MWLAQFEVLFIFYFFGGVKFRSEGKIGLKYNKKEILCFLIFFLAFFFFFFGNLKKILQVEKWFDNNKWFQQFSVASVTFLPIFLKGTCAIYI